jgi:predicted O-methyltransferase YrrM
MAYGISALYILSNKETTLTSIDPYQSTQWKKNAIKLLKELKLGKRSKCIEKKSYESLPELLKKDGYNSYDFIFIDGWHTFDYTLVDFFYANLLLKVGGTIIIDDVLHESVKQCVDYLNSNYKFYKKLESPKTVASYKKIKEDDREWNFHQRF